MHWEAKAGLWRGLGNAHPSTLATTTNLANLLHSQGKLDAAELLYREALDAQRHVLGAKYTSALAALNIFARLRMAQGRLPEALSLLHEALECEQRVHGYAPLN